MKLAELEADVVAAFAKPGMRPARFLFGTQDGDNYCCCAIGSLCRPGEEVAVRHLVIEKHAMDTYEMSNDEMTAFMLGWDRYPNDYVYSFPADPNLKPPYDLGVKLAKQIGVAVYKG